VGVLVRSNFGGDLTIAGVPVGRELSRNSKDPAYGSTVMAVAADAPVNARELRRMAARTIWARRTGSTGSNGSGDYAIAFSTVRNPGTPPGMIYNSLFKAVTMTGHGFTAQALPVELVRVILRAHGAI
jgi:D-aminopeptidase